MRAIEATKFPVQQMVTHTFQLDETENCIRAVGGEIAGLYPVKAVIKP
ncbi:MAG: Zinc-binding dehydrogenase [Deltaproteobacteria bacterium]|nr:Zinc-binding dehydrogenase [Deltaproteobacteria bacterium]